MIRYRNHWGAETGQAVQKKQQEEPAGQLSGPDYGEN